jgi:polar amino acid transport system substrate-binding protein
MKSTHALMCCAAFAGLMPAASDANPEKACTHMVASGNPEFPPYLWRDPNDPGRLIGANADFMQLLSREIGIPIETRYIGPWARVQEETRLGHEDLIVGAFLTMPRLHYMDYVYPPIRTTPSAIWTREKSRVDYQSWPDLRRFVGVTVIHDSFGQDFDSYAGRALKIDTVASVTQAIKMLQAGRADYLIYEQEPIRLYVEQMGVRGIKELSTPLSEENLFLTISYQSPCNTGPMRARLAEAMIKLTQSGVMDALLRKNAMLWQAQRAGPVPGSQSLLRLASGR